jgi:excisionase family DNA binding protein
LNFQKTEVSVPNETAAPFPFPTLSQIVPSSEWLTASEAAIYLKVAPRTLLSWARKGKVRGHVLSGIQRQTWRFRQPDLDACFKEIPWQN